MPRRIRAVSGGETLVDTTSALYAWEWPHYPQYYVPERDVRPGVLIATGRQEEGPFGPVDVRDVRAGGRTRVGGARVLERSAVIALRSTVRFDWGAADAWLEEDEEVFVHPRNPYTRVDALRSAREVRVELSGVVLAESGAPVMVFETGLPTRYYLDRSAVDFSHLLESATVTQCPYKGRTARYWSARLAGEVHRDLAWSYEFPTAQLLPISGLVAFYNERVDLFVDGELLGRPRTHFS